MTYEKMAAIDVCDVAVDLHTATIEQLNLKLPSPVTDWDLFSMLPKEDCARVLKLFNDPEFWRALPAVPGVHEGIEGLKRQGYKIHWVTSPWADCPNWEGIRRTWLNEQKLINDVIHDITFTSQKYRFAADMFVDDRPKHVKLWGAMNPSKPSLLFHTIFNENYPWDQRIRWAKDGIQPV